MKGFFIIISVTIFFGVAFCSSSVLAATCNDDCGECDNQPDCTASTAGCEWGPYGSYGALICRAVSGGTVPPVCNDDCGECDNQPDCTASTAGCEWGPYGSYGMVVCRAVPGGVVPPVCNQDCSQCTNDQDCVASTAGCEWGPYGSYGMVVCRAVPGGGGGEGVTLFEHSDFGGESITFTSDDSNLVDNGWNDKASSIKVSTGGEDGCSVGQTDPHNTCVSGVCQSVVGCGVSDCSSCGGSGPGPGPGPDPNSGGIIRIENPLTANSFEAIRNNLIDFIFKIAIILAPLMVLIGGFLLVTAGGNIQQIDRAKKLLLWAAIGFIVVLLSKGILGIIETILGRE